MLSELLYADDLVLMSETIEGLRNMFLNGRSLLRARVLELKLVCGSITKDVLSKCKVDPCGVCCLRVKANSVLCLQCGKWIHDRCAEMKRVAPMFRRNFTCTRCEGNTGEAVEQE